MFSAHDIAPREVPHCCSSSNLMLDSSVHTMRPDRLVELDIIFLLCTAGMRSFVPPTGNLQRTLATRMPLWPQHWSFSSAVSADSKVTVSHVTTDRPNSGSGMFVVLGDAAGRLYFFTAAGHLLFEHDTGNDKGQCLPYTGFRVACKQSVDGNLQHICSIRRCWWGLQELWHNSTNSSWQLQPDMQQSLAGLLMNRMRTSSTAAAACRWWWRSNSDLFGPAAQQHHTAGCGAAAGHGAAAGSDSRQRKVRAALVRVVCTTACLALSACRHLLPSMASTCSMHDLRGKAQRQQGPAAATAGAQDSEGADAADALQQSSTT